MDLIDKIKNLASRTPKWLEHIKTEEATKNTLIMPFIEALGYDVNDPTEVIPEFTADIGIKKGEKVDYAIKKGDDIIILIECKWSGEDLHKEHTSQLYRYFSATDARFAILTNGITYKFYSDIDERNKMDSKPFFSFNILEIETHQINELKKFTKTTFSLDEILTTASTLKYTKGIKKILEAELSNPSEDFVRFFASQIFEGNLTKQVLDNFTNIVKEARKQFINTKINERLSSALVENEPEKEQNLNAETIMPDNAIVTTEVEKEGYNIVKAILRSDVDVKRISMRDKKNYCGILLDNNNRKTICRMHFNRPQKYIGFIANKKEERAKIDSLDDIFNYAEQIKSALKEYLGQQS